MSKVFRIHLLLPETSLVFTTIHSCEYECDLLILFLMSFPSFCIIIFIDSFCCASGLSSIYLQCVRKFLFAICLATLWASYNISVKISDNFFNIKVVEGISTSSHSTKINGSNVFINIGNCYWYVNGPSIDGIHYLCFDVLSYPMGCAQWNM